MTHHRTPRLATGAAALLAVGGLALTGCKSSTTGSGSGNSSSSSPSSSSSSGSSVTAGSGSGGGNPYFPVAAGNTWVYKTKTSGALGTITNKMLKVVSITGGKKVLMEIINNAVTSTGNTSKFIYVFHDNGEISVPLTQLSTGSSQVKVKVKSGRILWPTPSGLASGQVQKSTLVFEVTTAGHTLNLDAHVAVKGAGTQHVTVPAGSYSTQVVDETMSETVEGFPVKLTVKTWLAKGVGPVKSEVLSSASTSGVPTTIQVLKSFTQG